LSLRKNVEVEEEKKKRELHMEQQVVLLSQPVSIQPKKEGERSFFVFKGANPVQ
jgi:hypothetical protein